MAKSFKIITLGCKVNQYESAFMREAFLKKGLFEAEKNDKSDITIVNTCTVTHRASHQSRQAIRKAIRENPVGRTAAVGCYAQVYAKELAGIKGLEIIAGNNLKEQLPDLLLTKNNNRAPQTLVEDVDKHKTFEFLPIKGFLNRTRAFLKIQDGCRSFCSYCIVPKARGPLRSLEPSKVISMLETLSGEGYKEVVLTGIHIGKYGLDQNRDTDLKGLLRLIGKEKFPMRIRLSSIEPNEIDQELIGLVVSEDRICRHFHIPLQSGDKGVLEKMNRKYRPRDFSRLIEDIHKQMPLAAIGVDVMVGFPGEDHHAYENTFSLIKDLPISYLHVFPFSPREGTPAAGFGDQVDSKIIKKRAAEIRKLGERKREVFKRSCIGKTFQVLTQGWQSEKDKVIKGLSDNYLTVFFPSKSFLNNKIVPVEPERIIDGHTFGHIIE